MPRVSPRIALCCALLLMSAVGQAQPGVANRCVLWGRVTLSDGSTTDRFAPEPIPPGPHYLHYTVMLNGDESRVLTELAPKWSPNEDVNIPGNGYYGCELGNFSDPEIRPGDKIQIIVTDEAAGEQGQAEVTVPELPGAINRDIQLAPVTVRIPQLQLDGTLLKWWTLAPVTLVYRRDREDRLANGKPRGQYELAARLTEDERTWEVPDPESSAWLIVQKDAGGATIGRSREVRRFRDPDGFASLIAVADDGTIFTIDHGAGEVTVWSEEGRRLRSFRLEDGFWPLTASGTGGNLIVMGMRNQEGAIRAYSAEGERLPELEGQGIPGLRAGGQDNARPAPDVLLQGGAHVPPRTWLELDRWERRIVKRDGKRITSAFTGQAFGGLKRPRDIAWRPDGRAYILDGDRIIVVPGSLDEELPRIVRQGRRRLVQWTTGLPTKSMVTVARQDAELEFAGPPGKRRKHSVEIGEVPEPGKYRVSVAHSIEVLGSEPLWATGELLVPPSKAGHTAFLRVKVAVVVWANAGQSEGAPEGMTWPGPIPQDEIDRLVEEMRLGALFYWINSHLRFFVDIDVLVDTTFHEVEPFCAGFRPTRGNTADFLRTQGKRFEEYDGICRIIAEQQWDSGRKEWRLAGRGGGFTTGVGAGSEEPGWSWWRACAGDYGIPDSWLFVHEYGHQVDAMFGASGRPEFWGNHFALQEGNVGRFGEHFDGNAYVLRRWPEDEWFASDWGTVELAVDADGDNVPDDDPRVPLDETRFGSSPERKDTDGDGLTDREEIVTWNGIVRGLDQVWGCVRKSDPGAADSDSDGVRDGRDRYPLYPISGSVPRRALQTGDVPSAIGEWPLLMESEQPAESAQTYLAWDEDWFYIGCRTSEPEAVLIQLDAENDGWFVGRDNYNLVVEPGPEGPTVRVHVVNAADEERWPFNDTRLVKPEATRVWTGEGSGSAALIAIPRNRRTGLRLEAGEEIGLSIGYRAPAGGPFLMLFEPHTLVPLTLAE